MCRNIRPLFNFEPPATSEEILAAALQFVRKVSGSQKPSAKNREPFDQAVAEVAASVEKLLNQLHTSSPSLDRQTEAAKAKARSAKRFAPAATKAN